MKFGWVIEDLKIIGIVSEICLLVSMHAQYIVKPRDVVIRTAAAKLRSQLKVMHFGTDFFSELLNRLNLADICPRNFLGLIDKEDRGPGGINNFI